MMEQKERVEGLKKDIIALDESDVVDSYEFPLNELLKLIDKWFPDD